MKGMTQTLPVLKFINVKPFVMRNKIQLTRKAK